MNWDAIGAIAELLGAIGVERKYGKNVPVVRRRCLTRRLESSF